MYSSEDLTNTGTSHIFLIYFKKTFANTNKSLPYFIAHLLSFPLPTQQMIYMLLMQISHTIYNIYVFCLGSAYNLHTECHMICGICNYICPLPS